MTALAAALALALAAPPAPAAGATPEGEQRPWTLEALQAAALAADPRVLAAAAELARLRGVEAEARAARRPELAWTLEGTGPVPELHDDPDHLDDVKPVSRLRSGEVGSVGVHTRLGASLEWPLFTFGKSDAREQAAARGVDASSQAVRAARARAARDAAAIYWEHQLARRGVAVLDDAERHLAGAHERVQLLVAQGSRSVTKQDLAQLDLLRAELAGRRAEASAARELALEAGRAVAGVPSEQPFAFAPAPLEPGPVQLAPLGRYVEVALAQRAEVAAAVATLRAREAQAAASRRALYPDLVATGSLDLNWTGSATPQTNPFAYDPYNRLWGGIGLALRGTLDLGRSRARAAQAEAEVEKARAELELASRAARLEVARAHGSLRAALERAARMREEEGAARRWLAQAELAFDEGSSGAQGVLLAALAATRADAGRLAAFRDAQLALADLGLAVGQDPRTVK